MEGQQITLTKILESKVYIHEKSQISFGSPKQYIEPFLEKLANSQVEWKVSVSERVANKDAGSDTLNEAYGRVLVEAKFPSVYSVNEHDHVIGMVYSLDTAKPTIRVYSGQNAWACTNLAIFGAQYVHQVEIMQGYSSIYDKTLDFVEGTAEQLRKFQDIHKRMNETEYKGEEINQVVGYLLREGYKNKQLGINPILSAVKDLDDPKSRYGIKEDKTSQWNVYSALTQYVTDKTDIFDKASKTVMLSNLFVKNV